MNADQLAAVVDPVAWTMAILGALGFVGMALVASIQCARHLNDGHAWAAERRDLRRQLAEANTRADAAEQRANTEAGARSDEVTLVRQRAAAAAVGLGEPPPVQPNGQRDPRDS